MKSVDNDTAVVHGDTPTKLVAPKIVHCVTSINKKCGPSEEVSFDTFETKKVDPTDVLP